MSLTSPVLAGGFFTTSTTWEARLLYKPATKALMSTDVVSLISQVSSQQNAGPRGRQGAAVRMAEWDASLDHVIPSSLLPPFWAKFLVGFASLVCFARSYDGDFVFDDSEAIVNNKVRILMSVW